MKIYLESEGGRREALLPFQGASFVYCPKEDGETCKCGGNAFHGGATTRTDRETRAPAICNGCKTVIGTLVVEHSTLFGLEEDELVLYGRCRVY